MKKIIVTGAGGLLGAHVVPRLDGEVYAVARGTPGAAAANVVPLALDLSRPIDPARLPEKVDAVIHLAQSNRYRDFPRSAHDMFQINTAQLVGLLDYAHRAGAAHFVYASTGSVYAPSADPLTEASPLLTGEPAGFYPATKLAGEILARSYSSLMSVTILRFFFIYGRGQKPDMLVPRLVESVRSGTPVGLQGEEGLTINPIHAADAADAVAGALKLDGPHTLNVAGTQKLSLKAMCDEIGRQLGREPVYTVDRDRTAPVLVADITALEQRIGRPRRSFAEGVGDLL